MFVFGLVKFVPPVARLVFPDLCTLVLLDYVLQTLILGPVYDDALIALYG